MKQPQAPLLGSIKQYRYLLALASIFVLAAFVRLIGLSSLPPGLHPDEAFYGVKALNLLGKSGALPLSGTDSPSHLFLLLQAGVIRTLGNSTLSLRLVPALTGLLSVAFIYLAANRMLGRRVASIAAFLVALSPWAITFSRLGIETSLVPLFVSLTLWTGVRALQSLKPTWAVAAGVSLGLGIYASSSIWWLALGLALITAGVLVRPRQIGQPQAQIALVTVASLAVVLSVRLRSARTWPHLVHAGIASLTHTAIGSQLGQTLLMFNYRGDQDFRYNVAGQPALNLFVGLMLVLGLLVMVTSVRRRAYSALLILFGVLMLSGVFGSPAPSARSTLVIMPIVMIIAAIGISYMLDIWYATFPVNAAARTLGTLSIGLLLLLTASLGYKQYFEAWGNSPEVYESYNERAAAIASFMNRNPYNGDRYGVLDDYSNTVVGYLSFNKAKYNRLGPNDTSALPKDDRPKQFIITTGLTDDYLKALKDTYPKYRLSQHYSEFNDANELFAVYDVR